MGIKGLLGFCECKGCRNWAGLKMNIEMHFPDGKTVKKSVGICKQHAAEAAKGGELKSVTVEGTIDID